MVVNAGTIIGGLKQLGMPLDTMSNEDKNALYQTATALSSSGMTNEAAVKQIWDLAAPALGLNSAGANISGLGNAAQTDFLNRLAASKGPLAKSFNIQDLMSGGFGLTPQQAQQAVLGQFGLNAQGGAGDSSAWARLAFDQQRAGIEDQLNAAKLAMMQGDQALAGQKFAEDTRQGRTALQQNLETQARNRLETGRGAYGDIGQLMNTAFNSREQAVQGRAGLKARGAEGLANLTSTLGNLGQAQAKLALETLSTPRNAIPAFLMARGQEGMKGMEAFAPKNLLGFDPNQMQSLIQNAIASANNVGNNLEPMQNLDMSSILQALSGIADRSLAAGDLAPGNIDFNRWGNLPSNQPSNPLVDNIIAQLGGQHAYQNALGGGGSSGGGELPAAPAPYAPSPYPSPDEAMGAPRPTPSTGYSNYPSPYEAMGAARPMPSSPAPGGLQGWLQSMMTGFGNAMASGR